MQYISYKRAHLYKCTSWACAKLFHVCFFFMTVLLEKYNVLIDLMFSQMILKFWFIVILQMKMADVKTTSTQPQAKSVSISVFALELAKFWLILSVDLFFDLHQTTWWLQSTHHRHLKHPVVHFIQCLFKVAFWAYPHLIRNFINICSHTYKG